MDGKMWLLIENEQERVIVEASLRSFCAVPRLRNLNNWVLPENRNDLCQKVIDVLQHKSGACVVPIDGLQATLVRDALYWMWMLTRSMAEDPMNNAVLKVRSAIMSRLYGATRLKRLVWHFKAKPKSQDPIFVPKLPDRHIVLYKKSSGTLDTVIEFHRFDGESEVDWSDRADLRRLQLQAPFDAVGFKPISHHWEWVAPDTMPASAAPLSYWCLPDNYKI